MLDRRRDGWQAVKFTLFSISAGAVQGGSFALFNDVVKLDYKYSYFIALALSVLWNFTFNRRYTFRSAANVPRAMALVALFYAVFAPLSTWWGDALSNAGWHDYVVLGLTMVSNFVLEFFYQRCVVYRGSIDTNDVARRARERSQETI